MSLTLAKRKKLTINVPNSQKSYYGKGDGFILKFSNDGKTAQVKVTEDIRYDMEGNVKKVISFLQKKCNTLQEPVNIEIYPYSEYGDEYVAVTLTGWRPATEKEIERAEEAYLQEQARKNDVKRMEIERARAILKQAGEL